MSLNKLSSCLSVILYCFLELVARSMALTNVYQDLTFASAQCQAICLKNFLKVKSTKDQCMKACRENPNLCEIHCLGSQQGCLLGCKYLRDILLTHPGTCPPLSNPDVDIIKQPSCLSKCKSDNECFSTLHKCCKIGCSTICVKPTFNESVPDLAPQLTPIKIPNSSDIEFEWMTNYRTFVSEKNPLTFILQTRVCPCKKFDKAYVEKWQTLIITSQSGARLNAFDQGKIYQFRLAVVSPDGTRGYGISSAPFPEVAERPNNPPSLKGLSELLTRVYSSGKISVTIGWQKSEEYVLPVSEYVVKWMIDYGYVQSDGQAISALTQFTQSVPPDKIAYVLENLKPNTSYRVEVLTKVYWQGDEPLISEPSTLFLSTPSLSQGHFEEMFYQDFHNCNSSTTLNNEDVSVTISSPIYVNGELNSKININNKKDLSSFYRVSWTPKICIDSLDNQMPEEHKTTQFMETKSGIFNIKNIHFNCRYQIKIDVYKNQINEMQNDKRSLNPPFIEGHFCVPSCSVVVGHENSDSPKCMDYINRLPSQPQNLSSKLINSHSKTYELSWNHPVSIMFRNEEIYQSRYRIVWGPRLTEPIKQSMYGTYTGLLPIIDASKSNVKVINKDINTLILTNLQPRTMYIVKAQLLLTLSDGLELESEISIHYFNTGLGLMYTYDIPASCPQISNWLRPLNLSIISLLTALLINVV